MLEPTRAEQLQQIYCRVRRAWDRHKDHLFSGECGYSILGSRPVHRPTLMVIGENPGFGAADVGNGPRVEDAWPDASYLEGDSWALKDRLRAIFSGEGAAAVLQSAVFTNFLFFKSGSLTREDDRRWSSLPAGLRRELEALCLAEVRKLIGLLEPQQILVLGMSAFDRHAENHRVEATANDGKRRLIATGCLWGVDALAMMHPTGARWSSVDIEAASEWLSVRFGAKLLDSNPSQMPTP